MVWAASDLVWPIRPTGPRLIQPRDVRAGQRLAVDVDDAAAVVGDGGGVVVERDAGEVVRAVADRAVDRLDGPVLEFAGAADVAGAVELGDLGAQAHDLAVLAEDLDGVLAEVDVDAVVGAGRLLGQVVLQHVDDELDALGGADRVHRALVELEALGVDDDVDVGGVAELAQLHRGELDLRRAAAGEDVDVLGGVGLAARRRRCAGISVTSCSSAVLASMRATSRPTLPTPSTATDSACGLEVPVARGVGVAVVPGDEVGGAERALEVDAGDVEVAVGAGAGREDHRVVELLQVVELEVGAVVDVAEEADVVVGQDALERLDDLLDARVVGRDAVADQAERRGVAIEDVDRDARRPRTW